MNTALAINNLTFQFVGSSQPLFQAVNLSFASRAIHYIQGDNGSGKSTLLHLLMKHRLAGSYSGNITCSGLMHLIAQRTDAMIAPSFTVAQNLALASMARFPGIASMRMRGIPPFLGHICPNGRAQALSGGQKQLLALAMAVQRSTAILLLDEPTAALDRCNAQQVFDVLYGMVQTIPVTIIVICHQAQYVQRCGASSLVTITAQQNQQTRFVTQELL